MILLAIISIASFLSLPAVELGKVEVKDLIMYVNLPVFHLTFRQKGRQRRWGAKEEELASLRFDVQADLNPLLNSYNTKQLFLYLTASYDESTIGEHEVVLWDRIITRGDMRDIRATTKPKRGGPKRGRGKVRVEEGKNKYTWKNPSGTFRFVLAIAPL